MLLTNMKILLEITTVEVANLYCLSPNPNKKSQLRSLILFTENFTEENSILMTAKINFYASKVGSHFSILEFVGAITTWDESKFFCF